MTGNSQNPKDKYALGTFSTFSEQYLCKSFFRTNHDNENLQDIGQLEMPLDDDDDKDLVLNSSHNKNHVISEENEDIDSDYEDNNDNGNDGHNEDDDDDGDTTLQEIGTWKIIALGGVLGYVALNGKEWMQYIFG